MARPRRTTKQAETEVKAPEVVPIPETKEPDVKIVNVYSVRYQLWHPFQNRPIPVNEPTPVILDSWLECQIKAGHIKEQR